MPGRVCVLLDLLLPEFGSLPFFLSLKQFIRLAETPNIPKKIWFIQHNMLLLGKNQLVHEDPQISSYVSVFAINNVWSKNEKHSYKFVLKGPVKTQPTFRLLTYIRCHRYYNIGFIINQSCWDEKIWFCTNLSWKLQITSIKWPDALFSGIIP